MRGRLDGQRWDLDRPLCCRLVSESVSAVAWCSLWKIISSLLLRNSFLLAFLSSPFLSRSSDVCAQIHKSWRILFCFYVIPEVLSGHHVTSSRICPCLCQVCVPHPGSSSSYLNSRILLVTSLPPRLFYSGLINRLLKKIFLPFILFCNPIQIFFVYN